MVKKKSLDEETEILVQKYPWLGILYKNMEEAKKRKAELESEKNGRN